MSQVKLTLRPPPNVDFVHGYPGIPPGGPDRSQAVVKGAIEVRAPAQGVKAKWVRIELRKVETLPGGGQSNTFYDFVGPSPVNVWTAQGEYEILQNQDFHFSIRIPESIPPTVALDNRAGINYELVASVCTRGKRSWFRSAKSTVSSTDAPIIIDKHDLHSQWPVYCQHEERNLSQEGVNLLVERENTCFGPGDQISIAATLKSDSLHTIILRGFELSLIETTVFRHGTYAAGKKANPQTKTTIICEGKLMVNATLYGGTQHKADIKCIVPPNHTTTTLNAARYIDVTYTLQVKAVMGTGNNLSIDLPVIISNWQRHVSIEAIRRIGPAPSLSLIPASTSQAGHSSPVDISSHLPPMTSSTLPSRSAREDPGFGRKASNQAYTIPTHRSGYGSPVVSPTKLPDELGYGAGTGYSSKTPNNLSTSHLSSSDEYVAPRAAPTPAAPASPVIERRPMSTRSTGTVNTTSRLTIANVSEMPDDTRIRQQTAPALGAASVTPASPQKWLTAEEEKRRYERARLQVERTQGVAQSPPPASVASPLLTSSPLSMNTVNGPPRSSSRTTPWPTAEEEKMRLFNQAQAAAHKTQGMGIHTPPASIHNRSNSDLSSGSKPLTTAEALYSRAMSSRGMTIDSTPRTTTSALAAVSSPNKTSTVPQYLTAEQEKAALRRYQEAKRAVDRTQYTGLEDAGQGSSMANGPIAYESLYPSKKAGGSIRRPVTADNPPPSFFDTSTNGIPAAHLTEKERMRRAYEAQDTAALLTRHGDVVDSYATSQPAAYGAPPPAAYAAPPPFSASAPVPMNAAAEKEALRRKFEAQDVANTPPTPVSPPQPPPRAIHSPSPITPSGRTRPTQMSPPSASAIMSAVEEKALLRAKYNAQDRAAKPTAAPPYGNGLTNGQLSRHGSSIASAPLSPAPKSTPPPPPPLMPKPPVEYIQETQEEDARVARLTMNGVTPSLDDPPPPLATVMMRAPSMRQNGASPSDKALYVQSFTPLTAVFEPTGLLPKSPGPPPPLPPKPAGE